MSPKFLDAVRSLFDQHQEIRLAIVFGSVAENQAEPHSDIDIAVSADHVLTADEKIGLIADLSVNTGRPVDLIDLKVVGEPLLGQILRKGKRILGSDNDYAELIKRHVFEEAGFMPYQRRILAERRQAWIGM